MSRVMVVTVGTSLFTSATWEPRSEAFPPENRGLPVRVPGYDRWLKADYLKDPSLRVTDLRVREGLKVALADTPASAWLPLLPADLATATHDIELKRFGAEMTTLGLMAKSLARDARAFSLQEFLGRYDEILVVADSPRYRDVDAQSRCAAEHLKTYINTLAGTSVARLLEIDGISSRRSEPLTEGLKKLQTKIQCLVDDPQSTELDLVLTGGYKVYGFLLTPLAFRRDEVRIVYAHEGSEDLIVICGHEIKIGDQEPLSFEPPTALPGH